MRKFLIQNEYGEKLELQNSSFFLYQPDGWGSSENIEYMETDGFFVETFRAPMQVEKTGTLIFKPNSAYKNYQDFANWIFAAESLTLGYKPINTWYYVDVDLIRMDKGELNAAGILEIPVVFAPTSPLYATQALNLSISRSDTSRAKKYGYNYAYKYAATTKAGTVQFTVDAQMPGDFSIAIPGEVSSPVIVARRVDTNTIIGKVDLSAISVPAGATLFFSTVPKEAGAKTTLGVISTDLTEYIGLDPNYKTFFKIPPNVPVEISVEGSTLDGVQATINVYRYFRTV